MNGVMLYCQYLSGMGHLVRSSQLAAALARRFEVTFVNGGPRIDGFVPPAGVTMRYLPPLWLEDGAFRVAGGGSVDEVKAERTERLVGWFDLARPEVVITEFFPFGRHDLLFELAPWLDHIRRTAPGTLIVSSLRDLIGKTVLGEQTEMIASFAHRWFDLVMVHADPAFMRFEDCYPGAAAIRVPVVHTGFVAEPASPPAARAADEAPHILVTIGGGRIGAELIDAALGAAEQVAGELPHQFRIFTGPFLEDADHDRLAARAADLANVSLARFTPDLMRHMAGADLSVSLAGYNTVMNVLAAGTPAILVPIGHYGFDVEQAERAARLEACGRAKVIAPEALTAAVLAAEIRAGLDAGRVASGFDLGGAENSAALIETRLAQRVPAAVEG